METVKLIQNNKIIKKAIIVFLGTILLTISAKIKIPFYPVPMTMQTFVVIFLGMCFGYKLGLTTVITFRPYLFAKSRSLWSWAGQPKTAPKP